tara:strand:- start:6370 stop:6843 length:474 start_codon:yes stop_codon:yes gene_type:complete
MTEVEIYLSARYDFTTDTDMGGFSYVLKSDTYSSTGKGSYFRTSENRMLMMACIEAMKDAYKNIGPVIKVNIHVKNTEIIASLVYSHCKKFKNYPNQDLVKQGLKFFRHSSFDIIYMDDNGSEEMKLADELAKEALIDPNRLQDILDFRRSLATPLF